MEAKDGSVVRPRNCCRERGLYSVAYNRVNDLLREGFYSKRKNSDEGPKGRQMTIMLFSTATSCCAIYIPHFEVDCQEESTPRASAGEVEPFEVKKRIAG
jgi:hypothetical protein